MVLYESNNQNLMHLGQELWKNKQSTKKPTLNMINTHSRNIWAKTFMNNIRVKKNEKINSSTKNLSS